MQSVQDLADKISAVIINPLLALIFGAASVVFVYGLVRYLYAANVKGKADNEAKKHMFWGLFGMFIMVGVFAIIRIVANTIGVSNTLPSGY